MRMEEKLGYGSTETPKVGDKCSEHWFSDCHACQVVKISKSGKTIWIRQNKVVADQTKELGMGHQHWIIFENEFEGSEHKVTLRKDGKWRSTGTNNYVSIGQWHEYYDWEF